MKIMLCLSLIGGTCISMLWAPKFSPDTEPAGKTSVMRPSPGATANELLGELTDGGIGRSLQGVAIGHAGSTITFPKRESHGSNAELYSVDEDGASGKYWLGVASGTIQLPKRGAIHLALPEDEEASFRLLTSIREPGIDIIEIPGESTSQRVVAVAAKVPGVRGFKLYGGTLRSTAIASLASAKVRSLVLMNVRTDEKTLNLVTRIPSLAQVKCIGMRLPESFLAGLKRVHNLDDVDFDDCSLPENAIDHLTKIKTLRRLTLADTGIGDDACVKLAKADGLTTLGLERNNITDAGIRALSPLVSLEDLELKLTNVTDASAKVFCALPNLTRLDLSYTHVTDAIVEPLSDTKIANLSLVGTSIGDAGASKFAQAVALKRLILDDTAVTDSAIEELRKEHPAAQIY